MPHLERGVSGNHQDGDGQPASQDSNDPNTNPLLPSRSSPARPSHHRSSDLYENALGTEGNDLQRRRSISMLIRHAGGPNSIDNFAQSFQRAAAFPEVVPRRTSVVITESDDGEGDGISSDHRSRPTEHHSLLGRQLEAAGPLIGSAIADDDYATDVENSYPSERLLPTSSIDDAFSQTSFGRSYGASYGTISSRINGTVKRHAAQLHKARSREAPDSETENLHVKQVQQEDGTKHIVVVGKSTLPQTVFNSVNVLIGIGLLSLPLGFKHAGWLLGMFLLIFSALSTAYTAKILAKCLDVDFSLVTYADLAYISFGPQARVVTSLLFCLELIGASVALIVLFADSLDALVPGLGVIQWKILCGIFLIPLNFLPLRLLSISSILGIISCTSILVIIIADGFIKTTSPGSLLEPARTYLLPENWMAVPLSFGLILAPWGGHSVFPNIYRDMRHPYKYGKSLWITYSFTYFLDLAMAVVGWLMFGDSVRDEITANIILGSGYPAILSICMVGFIAVVPLTKVPLSCHPIVGTIEVLLGINPQATSHTHGARSSKETIHAVSRVTIRILNVILMVVLSIIFPDFDRIMALVGSCLCFTICIILPVAFYLKIFGAEIPYMERVFDWVLLIVSSVMAAVGTVWAFLPKEQIGLA